MKEEGTDRVPLLNRTAAPRVAAQEAGRTIGRRARENLGRQRTHDQGTAALHAHAGSLARVCHTSFLKNSISSPRWKAWVHRRIVARRSPWDSPRSWLPFPG